MSTFEFQAEQRSVRIHITDGHIEGRLQVGAMLRTLDDLNVLSRKFLQVYAPAFDSCPWRFIGNQVAVNTSTILFLEEIGSRPAPAESVDAIARYTRASLHLRVGPYEVQGSVHVPFHGDPMSRLVQDSHPFLALTSASVIGPDREFTTDFLAVNRAHILAAAPLGIRDERFSAADPRQVESGRTVDAKAAELPAVATPVDF